MKTLFYEYRWLFYVDAVIYLVMVAICIYKIAEEDREYGYPWFYQIRMDFKNGWLGALWRYFISPFVWD